MAIPAYLYITDDAGNIIKGSVNVKGRENSIEVLGLHHNVSFSTDIHTGKTLSKREHRPFLLEKETDASSVYLYKALTSGETLKTADVKFYRINNNGFEEEYFSIKLENVKVVTVFSLMHDIKDPHKEKFNHMELVQLRYTKITWHYLDGNIMHSDEWDKRLA